MESPGKPLTLIMVRCDIWPSKRRLMINRRQPAVTNAIRLPLYKPIGKELPIAQRPRNGQLLPLARRHRASQLAPSIHHAHLSPRRVYYRVGRETSNRKPQIRGEAHRTEPPGMQITFGPLQGHSTRTSWRALVAVPELASWISLAHLDFFERWRMANWKPTFEGQRQRISSGMR